ncbi:unnamed protein product [Camellia sinensis]
MGNCLGRPAKCAHASSNLFVETTTPPSTTKDHPYLSTQQSLNKALIASKGDTPISNNLKSFTFIDLKNATKNFRSDSLLGEGGFGCVFKGWIDENTFAPSKPGTGIVVAIKKLKAESFQGHKEWLTEVNYLGQLHHENLVKLIGYCSEFEHKLLVYEFMPKGSLENHLFRKGVQPIPWATRMSIAVDVARGLSFLHNLDANDFNAKLSDFGLARAGPTGDNTHVSTRVVGTQGYAAPEYVATGQDSISFMSGPRFCFCFRKNSAAKMLKVLNIGHLTPKSDVYSFGVVLLELLSGRRAMGDERAASVDETLVDWAKPFLGDNRRILRIMDTRLGGQYSRKGAQAAAALVLRCLHIDPKNRPPMMDVLATLEQLHTSSKDVPQTPEAKLEHRGVEQSSYHRKSLATATSSYPQHEEEKEKKIASCLCLV